VFGVAFCWSVSEYFSGCWGIRDIKTYWSERLVHSIKLPRPAIWWSVPVMILSRESHVSAWSIHFHRLQATVTYMARLGEQAAAAWKSVNRKPLLANLSRFGVLISPPKQPKSLNPRSSATMTRKFGRLDSLEESMAIPSLLL
jgi:hypothetical protein